ncbi:MAG: Spy/CpxP family protein refolding chaperone [Gammaproteobacteria bacterium]|nr:Spy/CpxP family protein refolding chaperone [Gammaproteobacteria bacterium]
MNRTALKQLTIFGGLLLAANSFPAAVLAHDTKQGVGLMGDMNSAVHGMQMMGDIGHMPMMGGMQMVDAMDYMPMMKGTSHMQPGAMHMMRGSGRYEMLGLSDAQRKDVNGIHDGLRKQHWQLMGQMMDEQATLRDLYDTEILDPTAIGEAYARIFDLKRQMIETAIDARNRKHALLTEEQREQLKQMHRRTMRQKGMMQGGMMGQGGMMQGQDTMPSASPSE